MNKKELKKAFQEGLITEDKFKEELFKLETSKQEKRKIQRIYEALSEEQFIKLLEKTNKPSHKICFILGYGSGLRISEMTSLNPSDLNFNDKTIHIREGKGSKDRITYIPKWFRKEYLKYLPLKITNRAIESAFLRISLKANINERIGTFKRGEKDIPLYKFRVHSLRHSFATNALNEGVPIHQVQSLMGHSNLATTSRYTKANPKDAIKSLVERGL